MIGAAGSVAFCVVDTRAGATWAECSRQPAPGGCIACNHGTMPSLDSPLFDRMAAARKVFLDVTTRDGPSDADLGTMALFAVDHNTLDRRYVALWTLQASATLAHRFGAKREPGITGLSLVRELCSDDDPAVAGEATRVHSILKGR